MLPGGPGTYLATRKRSVNLGVIKAELARNRNCSGLHIACNHAHADLALLQSLNGSPKRGEKGQQRGLQRNFRVNDLKRVKCTEWGQEPGFNLRNAWPRVIRDGNHPLKNIFAEWKSLSTQAAEEDKRSLLLHRDLAGPYR
jgi:hypothetical protein